MKADSSDRLRADIESCKLCPRLRKYCRQVATEKKRAYLHQEYWGKPVANFGEARPERLLIVGLAPAAHGANRTGRMFTGDRSGQWLFRALHRAGFANQETYESADDGLKLRDCLITAVAHCAPPDNKPTPREIANCSRYLSRTFAMQRPRVIIALGGIAWISILREFEETGALNSGLRRAARPKFAHAAEFEMAGPPRATLLGCYHPSQQNTFTGRLTEEMLDRIMARAKKILDSK